MSENTLNLINDSQASWVDLRFTDTLGKEQHVSIPASEISSDLFTHGKLFDGSSIAGWKGIHESDMLLKPDDNTAVLDPFTDETTVNLRCTVAEPENGKAYNRCPRAIALRAEQHLQASGVADAAWFGPEPEFFCFDDVKWHTEMSGAGYQISSEEAAWSSKQSFDEGNTGHRPRIKGGYFPVPPVDSLHDIRAAMCRAMTNMGLHVEVHHHEVGTAGQCEIGVSANTLTQKADEVQILKYCTHNVAHAYGKTATFMPKPLVGENGNGMHCHQSLFKDKQNIMAGDLYAGLSETALFYIGGILKHACAINAFANASTNSYKRLVPGFEAPVILAYAAQNRSAAIRIPYTNKPDARRIEARFPDPSANPYLCFTALLMAGLDGIKHKIHPGNANDSNLYALTSQEAAQHATVASSLDEALKALDRDRDFLKAGNVMDDDAIDAYIALKCEEVNRLKMTTHPVEFDLYYSC